MKKYRALALFSGGIDSLLSVLWMQKLGYEVIPIFFKTPFFTESKAIQVSEANGLRLEVIDITQEHLEMLKSPRYGFGKNFNPCIDCHGLMFNVAGSLLEKFQADFLISGEVLGQRPMSQRKDALNAVGKLSGYRDLLVRPLSQKLLADTKPVREGWIMKEDLLDIRGRSRKPQISLAKELGVNNIPGSGGGCRLTDRNFSLRLKDLAEYNRLNLTDIELLKHGRHFRLTDRAKLIIGRNEKDNDALENLHHNYLFLLDENKPGPLGVLCHASPREDTLKLAASIVAFYNHKAPDVVVISFGCEFPLKDAVRVSKADPETVQKYIIMR